MDKTRLRLGLSQARCGVVLTLLGPFLLTLIPITIWNLLAVIGAVLPGLTILGLSNCRKAVPEVTTRAALVAWLSAVIATVLQFGVSLGIVVLDVTQSMVGQLYLGAMLFHLVSLQFLLVFASGVATFVAAPDLAVRFRNLSLVPLVTAVGMAYALLLIPKDIAIIVLLMMTLTFLTSLSAALGALATQVGDQSRNDVISKPLTLD